MKLPTFALAQQRALLTLSIFALVSLTSSFMVEKIALTSASANYSALYSLGNGITLIGNLAVLLAWIIGIGITFRNRQWWWLIGILLFVPLASLLYCLMHKQRVSLP